MLIRRVRVRAFRGIPDRTLEFDEGLNLVYGPNESGKSTLVQALRFGLFEPHRRKGDHVARLQSWYQSAPPEVEIELDVEGNRYVLEKRFLERAMARLSGAGRTWVDEDAERELHRLLEAEPPEGRGGRRGSREDAELGLWPLLCVPQGCAGDAPLKNVHERTRETLRARLGAEVGMAVAGPYGLAVLERARAERLRYFTDHRRQPTGELRQAMERRDAARQEFEHAVARRNDLRDAADCAAEAADQVADLDRRIAEAQSELVEVARRCDEVQRLDGRLGEIDEKVARLRHTLEEAVRRVAERARTHEQLHEAERRLAAERTRLSELDEAVRRAEADAQFAAAEVQRVEAEYDAAIGRATAAEAWAERARLQEERAAVEARLRSAERAHARWVELDASLRADPVGPAEVAALRDAVLRRDTLRARLDAIAPRVTVLAHTALEVAGLSLGPGDRHEWVCTAPLRLRLPGADVEVIPGGGDVAVHAAAERDALRDVEARLAKLGVGDLKEAEQRLEERRAREADVREARARLDVLAPKGVDALRSKIGLLDARIEDLTARAAALAASTGAAGVPGCAAPAEGVVGPGAWPAAEVAGGVLDAEALDAAARRARDAAQRARSEVAEAMDRRRTLDDALHDARRRREEVARNVSALEGVAATLRERLEGFAPADQLEREKKEAARQLAEAQEQRAFVERQRSELGGDEVVERKSRLERELENLRRERERKLEEKAGAEAKLRVLGGADLHEVVQRAETELGEAEAALERVQARAEAARRLLDVLEAAHREVQRRLSGPVERTVRPYLADLFGTALLDLSDDWSLRGLRSGDVVQNFDDLSAGAREQLALLVRLALLEVLAHGRRLPVVLDDALVNTDRARLSVMHRVLNRAAKRLQVILLTCHEHAFDGLGESRRIVLEPLRGSFRDARAS